MKYSTNYNLSLICLGVLVALNSVSARPLDFNEVSLLIRVRESEASIKDEVASRKLMRPLTPQQESTLKSQGASDSLIQSLRNTSWVASKDEVAAIETRDRQTRIQPREEMSSNG